NPLIVGLFGFNINRDTENNIVNSGFDSYQVRYLWYDFLRMFIINNKK
ncbi:MAG TPA: SAM-dependent methyltransferase, partial [Ignavibacteriales bacterium]|nr:SAM-dependent methyltransferase [Ignavibacteriales bacterium]